MEAEKGILSVRLYMSLSVLGLPSQTMYIYIYINTKPTKEARVSKPSNMISEPIIPLPSPSRHASSEIIC